VLLPNVGGPRRFANVGLSGDRRYRLWLQISASCRQFHPNPRNIVRRWCRCCRGKADHCCCRGVVSRFRSAVSRFRTAVSRCQRFQSAAGSHHPGARSAASAGPSRSAVSCPDPDRCGNRCLNLFLVSLVCSPYNCSLAALHLLRVRNAGSQRSDATYLRRGCPCAGAKSRIFRPRYLNAFNYLGSSCP
jgi:hypothetical protein